MFAKHTVLALGFAALCACGSGYTLLDRTTIQISPNSEVVARTLLPGNDRFPQLVRHLALAEEIYQKQLNLLRERRNKTRARKRDLSFAAYGIIGTAALDVGGLAIDAATNQGDHTASLVGAGAVSLVGLGIGTILQLTSALQEEPSVADDKVRTLQRAYDSMLERVRTLSHTTEATADPAQAQANIAAVIESFISLAQEINVKG